MATIENDNNRKSAKQHRSHKKDTRVDLTPMVDLGFLLITFFVFTTQLSKPAVMNLNMPFDKVNKNDNICASCVITLFLKANNTILYYEGMPESNTVLMQTSFSAAEIRNVFLLKKKQLRKIRGNADDFVLIIKSDNKSTFQNLVDIVDEVAINNIKHYYLDEISPADRILLSKK